VHDDIRAAENRLLIIRQNLQTHDRQHIEPDHVRSALGAFEPMWDRLAPAEQARLIQLLVERVEYDGGSGAVSVTFSPTGLAALAREHHHGVAA
jgi:site-specific DNA recombinase